MLGSISDDLAVDRKEILCGGRRKDVASAVKIAAQLPTSFPSGGGPNTSLRCPKRTSSLAKNALNKVLDNKDCNKYKSNRSYCSTDIVLRLE